VGEQDPDTSGQQAGGRVRQQGMAGAGRRDSGAQHPDDAGSSHRGVRTVPADSPASARTPLGVRMPRALREFVAVPVLVVVVMLLLAAVSIVGDQAHGSAATAVRNALSHLIGKESASGTLSAVATGLVTVTSITFSVLLLAVQQTASTLSPVVFDQFVRRRTNQFYLGLFVGLALYAYVVLAAVQSKTPPVIGAFIATVLTVVALACLLFLVYSTIDQMRPDNVVRQLHDRAIAAHGREGVLVTTTRRTSRSTVPVAAEVHCPTYGFVETVDLKRLVAALGPDHGTEVELHVTVGAAVVAGDLLATIRHHDRDAAKRLGDEVIRAVPISRTPDIDVDASTAVRDLSNIGWTSGSSSKQNPAIAAQTLHALRDLAARWLAEGDRSGPEPHPVVYRDDDVDTVLEAVYSAMVVAQESHQHQQAARVLETYEMMVDVAHDHHRDRILRDLEAMQPLLDQLPTSPAIDRVRARVHTLR
jgi:uncharacterized membrane protein